MTKTEAPIEEATVIPFDPAEATEEFAANFATKAQANEILAHYKLPECPPKWKLSDHRKMAVSAIRGAVVARESRVENPESTPVVEEVREDPVEPIHTTPEEAVQPGTEVEQRRPDMVNVFPEASRWQQITSMSVAIYKSSLCPKGLKSAEDVAVVLLAANDLGIPLTQALDKIYVIHGKKGMAAELMIALAQRDGHVVQDAGSDATCGRVYMRRRDTGAESTFEFTLDEAIAAKLVGRNNDGKLVALNDKETWVKFTADMLWARAVSRGSRRMMPDVLAGVSYTPDELGYIDADDDPPKQGRNAEAPVTIEQRRSEIGARVADVKARAERVEGGQAIREAANAEARRRSLPPIREATAGALSGWAQVMTSAEEALDRLELDAEGDIDEAEVVTEPEGANPGAGEAQEPEAAAAVPEEPESGTGPLSGSSGDSSSEAVINPVEEVDEVCGSCFKAIEAGDSTVEKNGEVFHVGHEPF